MKTREEIALAVLSAICAESLNHDMDPHAIASDAFDIADAFIRVRDAAHSKGPDNGIVVDWGGVDAECGFTAECVVMDADGQWFAHAGALHPADEGKWRVMGFENVTKHVNSNKNLNWRNSLVERPK